MADFDRFELKPISVDNVPQAIGKAAHYRLLNQPQQAESICLDVLDVDSGNQRALVTLILAMTDQFATDGGPGMPRTKEYLKRLTDAYERSYYEGIIHERHARALLGRALSRSFAYDSFLEAMAAYETAMQIRPQDDDESILRWNACVRTVRNAHLRPRPQEAEQLLE